MRRPLPFFPLLLAAGCLGLVEPTGPVDIRVANESGIDFDQVIVGFPDGQEAYGPVSAGERTDYRQVPKAYRYAYFEVHVESETLVAQPVDYVGETPLPPGRYTYAFDVDPAGPTLSFEFRRDD